MFVLEICIAQKLHAGEKKIGDNKLSQLNENKIKCFAEPIWTTIKKTR